MKPLCERKVDQKCTEMRMCDYGYVHSEVGVLHSKKKRFLAYSNKEIPRTHTCCTKDTLSKYILPQTYPTNRKSQAKIGKTVFQ